MKRLLAFVLVLLGVVGVMTAPAAALVKSDFDTYLWDAMKVSGVLVKTDGSNAIESGELASTIDQDLLRLGATEVAALDVSALESGEGIANVTDLKGISQFTNLERLVLGADEEGPACTGLTSVSLSGLTKLATVDLRGCTGLTSVSLSGLVKLTELTLPTPPDSSHNSLTSVSVTGCGTSALDEDETVVVGVTITLPGADNDTPAMTTLDLTGTRVNCEESDIFAADEGIAVLTKLTSLVLADVTAYHETAPDDGIVLTITPLTKLQTLDVSGSNFEKVDTAGAVLADLTTLDVAGAKSLTTFGDINWVTTTQTGTGVFDLQYVKNIETLDISDTRVTSLDISNQQMLYLTTIVASSSDVLEEVKTASVYDANNTKVYYAGAVTTLDLSKNPKLSRVYNVDLDVTATTPNDGEIVLTGFPALTTLNLACEEDTPNKVVTHLNFAGHTALVSADVSYYTTLGTTATVDSDPTDGIDAEGCTALTELILTGCPLGASGTGFKGTLNLTKTALTEIDLSDAVYLGYLKLSNSSMVTLDLSANTALVVVQADENSALEALDLSSHTALRVLRANENTAMTSLNLNGCTGLYGVQAYLNTALTSVDVGGDTALEYLEIRAGKVKTLDISDCTALRTLVANNNGLKTLTGIEKCLWLGGQYSNLTAAYRAYLNNYVTFTGKNAAGSGLNVANNGLAELRLNNQTSLVIDNVIDNAIYHDQTVRGYFTSGDTTFDFSELGISATEFGYVRNIRDGGTQEPATVAYPYVTFAAAPATIAYDYQTGLVNTNATAQNMDVVIEVGVSDDDSGSGTTSPDITVSTESISESFEVGSTITYTINVTSGSAEWSYTGNLDSLSPSITSDDTSFSFTATAVAGTYSGTIIATPKDTTTYSATPKRIPYSITVTDSTPKAPTISASTTSVIAKISDDVSVTVTARGAVGASTTDYVTWEYDVDDSGVFDWPENLKFEPTLGSTTGGVLTISGKPEAPYSGDVTVFASNATGNSNTVTIHFSITEGGSTGGSSSSSGCDAGFGALALALVGLFGLKRK